jgi:glycosyltransferase involved in cell wall biosynthesis
VTEAGPLICHLNLARGFRGGERQTQLLVRELARAGVRQRVVGRRGEPLLERLTGYAGVETRAVGGTALGAWRGSRGGDLLHAHEAHGAHGAFLRGWSRGVPYVLTRRVSNVPGGDAFTRAVYGNAACIVSVARSVAEVMTRFAPGVDSAVIHSALSELPVDADEVASLRAGLAGRFVVGHVGALDEKTKGQSYIIETARSLRDSHPDMLFLLIGGGRDEAYLKDLAAGLENVRFTGFVHNVGDYLSVMDVFILPSMTEGIGGIALDAMQFGLPVVASRVGGLPEIVHDGRNGLLVEPRDVAGLRAAILALHDDPALRAACGAAGKAFVADFTPARMAQRYLTVYENILARSLT